MTTEQAQDNNPSPPDRHLSDLAVSPYGNPAALLQGEIRVAFAGRTSTEDKQDPRQSLMRQLDKSKFALPPSWVIVAHYYDVESGRKDITERGHGADVSRFNIPIPRDGGIDTLVTTAARPDRHFDVVICESMSRLARQMYGSLTVERQLEQAGMALFASNEPIQLTTGRAQQILQRRINQSVAEYEALNILETSWGGLCTHIRDGYNIGKPPYGYKAKTIRHPNPAKAAKGATKSRLEPDGIRGETITLVAHWRYHERIGYNTIADRLNTDHEKHPPPVAPCKRRSRGSWSKSAVFEILRNPKYTGYQVFNRRATTSARGKCNPPEKWVWSSQPTHEPLIPRWMFEEINKNSRQREGSRDGNGRNQHPQTNRQYLLRGMITCECGRRMRGKVRNGVVSYACQPMANNRANTLLSDSHPKGAYINERALLDAVSGFYSARIFGNQRKELLAQDLTTNDQDQLATSVKKRQQLSEKLADIKKRQDNILQQVQTADPHDPFSQGLRRTYNELEVTYRQTQSDLAAVDTFSQPDQVTPDQAVLLDALPVLSLHFAHAPMPTMRRLFEATQLSITVNPVSDRVSVTVTVPNGYLGNICDAAFPMATPGTTETNNPSTTYV